MQYEQLHYGGAPLEQRAKIVEATKKQRWVTVSLVGYFSKT